MPLWITDPKTKEGSVSLSMLAISFVAAVGAMSLHMADIITHTSMAAELFYSTAALYFSRRFNIKGKTFSSETTKGE